MAEAAAAEEEEEEEAVAGGCVALAAVAGRREGRTNARSFSEKKATAVFVEKHASHHHRKRGLPHPAAVDVAVSAVLVADAVTSCWASCCAWRPSRGS